MKDTSCNKETYKTLFYKTLFENISNTNKEQEDDNICLISGESLDDSKLQLECGHWFNYFYIYKEIKNQKCKYNKNELQHIKKYQIKCPYCRNIQNSLLPPYNNFTPVTYVNSPIKYCMKNKNCKYVFKSGKRKGEKCDKKTHIDYCSSCKTNMKRIQSTEGNNIISFKKCECILKSGKRKGEKCEKKISKHSTDSYCGIHNKMKKNIKELNN